MHSKFMAPLLALALCLIPSRAGAENAPKHTFEKVRVAEGIVAFISSESDTDVVSGNCIAIVGEDGVLVVDSTAFPSDARQIIAEIKQMTNQPIRFLVHTHWHPDHILGDGEFRAAFPEIAILSTGFTQKAIAELAPKYIKAIPERGAAYSASLRKQAQEGKSDEGKPLSEADKKYYLDSANDIDFAIPEYKQYQAIVPNVTFEDALTIRLGKREVRMLFLGRGNTSGDAVIFVPDAKAVMAGDLLVAPTPYSYGSFLTEWIQTLAKVKALGATSIVPGHGPVERDSSYLDLVSAALQSVLTQVQAAAAKHLSLEDTRKQVDLAAFREKFCGKDHDREIAYQNGFVDQAIKRAYEEATFTSED
jgi:glyoxylase-like metal-dependent hydrolase (beta-lactamase superfamily II)